MTERELFLRAFHDARPGITARALARTGSYRRLVAKVPEGRVLDLACGDGELLALLGPRGVGLDLSRGELERARVRARARVTSTTDETLVQARAQELPFRDACFDAVTCHLAFMLFDDIQQVVAELSRVLKPRAPFIALLGGGPTADGADAFHHFASLLPRSAPIGHHRAWEELFAGWRDISVERWPLDLSGSFEQVWTFLGASYQLRDPDRNRIHDELRAAFPGTHVPCTVVTYCATATR